MGTVVVVEVVVVVVLVVVGVVVVVVLVIFEVVAVVLVVVEVVVVVLVVVVKQLTSEVEYVCTNPRAPQVWLLFAGHGELHIPELTSLAVCKLKKLPHQHTLVFSVPKLDKNFWKNEGLVRAVGLVSFYLNKEIRFPNNIERKQPHYSYSSNF